MAEKLKESQKAKLRDIELITKRYTPQVRKELHAIDYRLAEYFDSLTTDVDVEFGSEHDRHNRWELLCGAKFLRMFGTYNFNRKFVRYVIWFREGKWERKGKTWQYVSGGLKLPSTAGAKVYRWQPFQVFVLASVFGFQTWFNTHVEAGTKPELLSSERERDGMIWDFRRLVTEFIMYGPRKIDKTGLSAYIQVIFFLFGDFNSEIYSLAMTQDQSKILFDRTKFMLAQVSKDQEGNERFRMTQKIVDWKEKYQKDMRNSKIVPLTGGGKAPDGTNTELLDWDELGSSPYVNGKSDMMAHINVCQSSMGQRRQPLTFGTTTAGTITTGPFIEKLEVLHKMLLMEHDYEAGTATPTLVSDGTMCLMLEPDEYERENEEYILTSHALRRKINPMLGLVVQYDFYEREMEKARQEGGQKFAECVAKLFNVYQNARVETWIVGDEIRPLQREDRRINDCIWQEGWGVMTGFDFSHGDDLYAIGYLGIDYQHAKKPGGASPRGTLFADCDAWVLEETLKNSPNRLLYELWIQQGWLKVCPGKVFNMELPVYAIAEHLFYPKPDGTPDYTRMRLDMKGFSYDPAQSLTPINALKAFLQYIGIQNDAIKQMVIPCSQSAMNMNPVVAMIEEYVRAEEPWIEFSASPLWTWCFSNCGVELGRTDLRRIVKGGNVNGKIDVVAALLDAAWLFGVSEGRIEKER